MLRGDVVVRARQSAANGLKVPLGEATIESSPPLPLLAVVATPEARGAAARARKHEISDSSSHHHYTLQ